MLQALAPQVQNILRTPEHHRDLEHDVVLRELVDQPQHRTPTRDLRPEEVPRQREGSARQCDHQQGQAHVRLHTLGCVPSLRRAPDAHRHGPVHVLPQEHQQDHGRLVV